MANLISFINSFASYLLLSLIIAVLVVVGVFIGISLRKSKNLKASQVQDVSGESA